MIILLIASLVQFLLMLIILPSHDEEGVVSNDDVIGYFAVSLIPILGVVVPIKLFIAKYLVGEFSGNWFLYKLRNVSFSWEDEGEIK